LNNAGQDLKLQAAEKCGTLEKMRHTLENAPNLEKCAKLGKGRLMEKYGTLKLGTH